MLIKSNIRPGFVSTNFSESETVITSHRDIENIPNATVKSAILKTALKLEVVRTYLNYPITVNSWYRGQELNKIIGGSLNSDHMKGTAVDFICPKFGTPYKICETLIENAELIGFKQLIYEHTWVHISWDVDLIPNSKPKLQVLTLLPNRTYASGLVKL
jgi:hypothetical protein